jgi:multiple sugar transport system permease protein
MAKKIKGIEAKIGRTGYTFISPTLIHYAIFFWIPLILIILVSFTDWDMFNPMKFIGVKNYSDLFTDPFFRKSILISLIYAVSTTFLVVFVGMLIAILFDRPGPVAGTARILFFMTAVIPLLSGAAIWVYITGPEPYSGLNLVMKFLGLKTQKWQADSTLALPTVIGFAVWKNTGFNVLIYTAGIRGIPKDYLDCAEIDGANAFQRMIYLTIPLLRPITIFLLVTNMISGWAVFTPVWFITKGGPGSATRIMTSYIYEYGFGRFEYGYASAAAVILIAIVLVFTYLRLRRME